MRLQTTTLGNISREETLRYDVDYTLYQKDHEKNYYMFSELFDLLPVATPEDDALYSDFDYCEIGNADKDGEIDPVTLNFNIRNLEDENYYKKIENGNITEVNDENILIAKVRPNLKKFIYISDKNNRVFFTTAFIRLRPKKMPLVMYYGLRTVFYNNLMAIARQGKGYPTISENDIVKLRFDKDIIDALIAKQSVLENDITTIRLEIEDLHGRLTSSTEIIDEVFQREFGYDYEKFEELKSHRLYGAKQDIFSNNPDLRFSAKFHRPAGEFVMEQLTAASDKKIKHFLAEPIVLGASISPADFDETGEAYYVSMATIKTLEVVLDETQLVSEQYYAEKKDKKSLQKNDIIVARSGVAIGKSAIVTEEFEGIFADFTMRIRFDESKYNPMFAYYYIRSKYFQYLIEVYKKGLQNQNIFPIVMQEFPVPDISLSEQERIVKGIQDEIDKQEEIKDQIASLRQQIDKIITDAID